MHYSGQGIPLDVGSMATLSVPERRQEGSGVKSRGVRISRWLCLLIAL